MKRPGLTRSICDLKPHTLVLPPAPTKGEGADDSPCPHARDRSREEDPQVRQVGRPQAGGDCLLRGSIGFHSAGLIEAVRGGDEGGAAARLTLARTVPTTPAGLAAIMGFVWSQTVEYGRIYFDDAELAAFIFSVASAAQALASVFERLV